jgi:hypothetical protein
MTMKAGMICFRFGDELELGREDRMVTHALNSLVHPETPPYSSAPADSAVGFRQSTYGQDSRMDRKKRVHPPHHP